MKVLMMAAPIAAAGVLGLIQPTSSPAPPAPNDARSAVASAPVLTGYGARAVLDAALDQIRALKTTGAVAIVDEGGHLIAFQRSEGTFPAASHVSIGKAKTAAIFRKPTRVFEEAINKGRYAMTAMEGFTPLQGGVPIIVEGRTVGAIGISGAASAQQDDDIATAAATAFMQQPSASAETR